MQELLAHPAVQGGLAPLLAGMAAALVLAPARLSGLAAAFGFFTAVYLTGQLGLDKKLLMISAAAGLLGALADLAFRPTRAAGVVLGIAFGVAAFWIFLSTLGYLPAQRLVLHAVGIAAFVAITVIFSMLSQDEAPKAGAAGVGLGLASGVLAILGGAKVLALWAFGLAAGSAGFLITAIVLGRRVFAGASLTLAIGVIGAVLAVAVALQRGLRWYYVALLCLIPLAVRLPAPRRSAGQAIVALVYALVVAGAVNALAGCAARPDPIERDAAEPAASIYVVTHGWHTGIAIARGDVPPERWPESTHFAPAPYLEVGWGDRDFYMAPGFNAWYGLKALFWPTASVVHVAAIDGSPQLAFPASEVVELKLTRRSLDGLIDYLSASFERSGQSEAVPLGRGLYGVASAFYPSPHKFHLFNTCNAWTARALRAAGIPTEAGLTTESIMAQLRKKDQNPDRRRID